MILTNGFLKYRTKMRGCFCHIDQGYHKTIIFLLSNGHSCGNRCRCEQRVAIRQHSRADRAEIVYSPAPLALHRPGSVLRPSKSAKMR